MEKPLLPLDGAADPLDGDVPPFELPFVLVDELLLLDDGAVDPFDGVEDPLE